MASVNLNRDFLNGLIAPNDVVNYAIDFISTEFDPDDVFSKDKLEAWALDNGFVKE